MKKCRRTIHAVFVAVLITAAIPTMAQRTSQPDQSTFGVFARIESFVARLWTTITEEPPGPDISPADGAVGGLGAEVQPVGEAVEQGEPDRSADSPEG